MISPYLNLPLRSLTQVLAARRRRNGRQSIVTAREALLARLEAQARASEPAFDEIVDLLRAAADLLFGDREPSLAELTNLILATRGLRTTDPKYWRYSAQHAISALGEPAEPAGNPGLVPTRFTRQDFEALVSQAISAH